MREAGVLMPLSSLPSDYGIGDMGTYSYEFIDLLEQGRVSIWQILPLNPLGYGNSPYQPYSSFAGDEIYISLDELFREGMLKEKPPKFHKNKDFIDYELVRKHKEIYLKEAFSNFTYEKDYKVFISQEWVYLYAVYLTLKKKNDLICWNEWQKTHKDWIKSSSFNVSVYDQDIQYEMFVQYIFYTQWMKLKKYANQNGIKIMGDIPFYVGIDSLDVWSNQECFLLGVDGQPIFIAGVPPDYFSTTGQRWGNPIYNWDYLKDQKYKFWMDRIAYNSKLFDIIRIDHFRAFDTFWKIPVECETAVDGEWVKAPGYDVLGKVKAEFPEVEIIVEDLGELRDEVYELKKYYGLKGMKVIQFTFSPEEKDDDFEDVEEMIVYTGTHDNQTIKGWFLSQKKETQVAIEKNLKIMGYDDETISERFIRLALDSIAQIAILPMQDILDLGDEARINTPGTIGKPNWEWKLTDFQEVKMQIDFLSKVIQASGR